MYEVLVSKDDLPKLENTREFKFKHHPSVCLLQNHCVIFDSKIRERDGFIGFFYLDELINKFNIQVKQ